MIRKSSNDAAAFTTMLVVPDFSKTEKGTRSHPWRATDYRPEHAKDAGRYYNFLQSPELIPELLEDFKPYDKWPAIQHFYSFLAWINGEESQLETNDCAFRGPQVNTDSIFRKKMKCDGRIEIFHRDHQFNVLSDCFLWMERMLCLYLQTYRPDFYLGLITTASKETTYLFLPEEKNQGERLSLTFNAYGDSDNEMFGNLFTVFDGIWIASKRLSAAFAATIPEFP